MIRPTSLLAYIGILETLGDRQRIVYRTIRKLKYCNNNMIANELGLPINTITPRVNELRKIGMVMFHKKDICPFTNKLTIFWRVRKEL